VRLRYAVRHLKTLTPMNSMKWLGLVAVVVAAVAIIAYKQAPPPVSAETAAPILLIGTAGGGLASRLDRAGWRPWVNQATGLVLLGVGFYLLWTA
jgi:uncharacterized membrane protein YfcA